MAAAGVAVNCYWNGRVKKEQNDVVYQGAEVNVLPIKVFHGTTYAELLDKIYATTAINRENFELNIICRYPISSEKYKPIPIKNDEGVELMLEVPSRSGVYCVEIYLEEEPAPLKAEAIALLKKATNGVVVVDEGNNNGETSSKLSNDSHYKKVKMEGQKWEDLNKDILVNVLGRVGMESLLLDVPFVCKSWYKISTEPQCWEHLIFPTFIKPDDGFAERLAMKYQENLSITAFVKFIVSRSCGNATTIKLPADCTKEALEYIANECPMLKVLDVGSQNPFINFNLLKFMSKWKNLEILSLGTYYVKEVLQEIGLHCNNFISLSAPYNFIEEAEALALVTSLPKLKYLDLHGSCIKREALVMILQGCKQLVHLNIRYHGGIPDFAEILELASRIPSFLCERSVADVHSHA